MTGNVTLYAVWKQDAQPATSAISALNYGDNANYSVTVNGTEISDWKVFLNDETYVFLIASECIPASALPLKDGISADTYGNVSGSTGQVLCDWIKDQEVWAPFAGRIQGAIARGGPSQPEINSSGTAKHGSGGKISIWNTIDAQDMKNDPLYFPSYEGIDRSDSLSISNFHWIKPQLLDEE